MLSDHTRSALVQRQKDVEKSLLRLGFFETHDPTIVQGVLEELKFQGATIDWKQRVVYFPWVNGFIQINDDGVICSPPAS